MYAEKHLRLADPVVSAGDRVYCISTQNGLFPDPWSGHVPHEMGGVWDHPIKLLDGFWIALRPAGADVTTWLMEADACRVYPGYTEFDYRIGPLRVVRRDFAPDGVEALIVEIEVLASSSHVREASALEAEVLFRSDLRPAWLGERVGMQDAQDTARFDAREGCVVFRDGENPWFAVVGAPIAPLRHTLGDDRGAVQPTHGRGTSARLTYALAVEGDGVMRLKLLIAGSAQSEAAAIHTFGRLRREHQTLFEAKRARYEGIAQQSILETPDMALNEAFYWAKLNCQMLAREVPELGRGAGAGLPSYPWWFGIDTAYSILPMLQAGLFDLAKETLRLLQRASLRHNPDEPGRVIHELTTTGVVFNPGNLVETPAFTRAVHQTWLWSGDRAFLEEMYPFCKAGILDYALGLCDPDGDLCPAGRSIIETLEMHAGFECIDPAAYTWEALLRLSDMAQVMGEASLISDLHAKAAALAQRIRDEWWMADEGLFADVRASVREVQDRLRQMDGFVAGDVHPDQRRQAETARRLFEPALARRAGAPQDEDLPWLLRHWVIMCPMEVGVATAEQAARAFARLESAEFSGEWGMYLHPLRHNCMSINTGILALAEARYGRNTQALRFIRALSGSLPYHMPGAISEALPDQWCFIQLWSALGVSAPAVRFFLGVEPRAGERRLRVVPNLPDDWERAALRRLRIGEDLFEINVERRRDAFVVRVAGADYDLTLGAYLPPDAEVQEVTLNGQTAAWRWETTTVGRCVVCEGRGTAEAVVEVVVKTC